jgi:hypothetical protein
MFIFFRFLKTNQITVRYIYSNKKKHQSEFLIGAFGVGDRHRFKNVYIGWGVKNFDESQHANMIDILPENEYVLEIIEQDDPTVEEENELFQSSILLSPDEDEEFEDNIESN